jgi:hypothetical protein
MRWDVIARAQSNEPGLFRKRIFIPNGFVSDRCFSLSLTFFRERISCAWVSADG